ncbi:MAG TPA: glycoside hydrolase family 3 N-terminal domain-containing protein [Cyclobacteriaceae bacterium]|jgi:beta-N-acetylhexosaminidase|nr:glycoside hydrolase family 3 protein [Cytophagales bacterium]HRE66838.1 glycoside hydrolase family 3 N-terminal domain-containing protein [Cyclobacteriaceae bacterium]HRF33224.1 glycoside hydrolase family 3 N-terminal domain-containing protein [Cyclobacteriaceae bacterium]
MKRLLFWVLSFACFWGQAQTPDLLDIKIGQMILIGMPRAEVDPLVLDEVKKGKVGALIFFEKNIPNKPNAFASVKNMTWTYQKAASIPLFICIDQEGGKVNRLKEKYGFTRSVTAGALGKSRSLDSVAFYAEATAATLAGLGFNVNFAPVVDLAITENTVIFKPERAYSSNEDTVALMAAEVVKQHRKFGVITALKHFPGHGSSKEDTHFGVADVTNTWNERELTPYKKLVDANMVDAVMTAHIVNKNLDSKGYPGTLSKEILDGILRKRLGYNGVVFSDDMQMHAISKNFGLEESIKLAINAGVDILCFSNNISGSDERTVDKVHSIIKKLVASGEIKPERIDESFQRIVQLKSRIGNKDIPAYKAEIAKLQDQLNKQQTEKIQEVVVTEPQSKEEPEVKKKKRKRNQ